MRTKRSADPESPASTPARGSPKKTKTPPKKSKQDQTLTYGQPCEIKYFWCADVKLWYARQTDDKSDAFMKNIIDEARSEQDSELRTRFDFKGDVTRRISLTSNEPMKNHRKSYERKFLVQIIEEDKDTKENDAATGNALLKVSNATFSCILM